MDDKELALTGKALIAAASGVGGYTKKATGTLPHLSTTRFVTDRSGAERAKEND